MKFKVALRKKSKALSFRKRYLSLSSIEQVRLKKLKKLILALMVESELSEGADEKEDINLMLEALVAKYLSITVTDDVESRSVVDSIALSILSQQVIAKYSLEHIQEMYLEEIGRLNLEPSNTSSITFIRISNI